MRRAQIGMFIIVGVAVLFIASFAIFSITSANEKKGREETKNIATTAPSIESLKKYVESCMENTLKEGLLIIGLQGGYIEGSQGGPYEELLNYVPITENGKSYKVRIGIKSPSNQPNPEFYPTEFFPYGPEPLMVDAKFSSGEPKFDQLIESAQSSFELHLKSYVHNNLETCMDFSSFEKDEGMKVTTKEHKEEIIIGQEETSFALTYPLEATNERTDEHFTLQTFKVTIPIRLGIMHEMMKTLVTNDVNDITFSLPPNGEISPGITITTDRSTNNPTDIITLTDNKVQLNGKSYQLNVARKNRAPALRHFEDYVYNPSEPFGPEMLSYVGKAEGLPMAIDPDEDSVSVVFQIDIDDDGNLEMLQLGGTRVLINTSKEITIVVTDGHFIDSQIITISPAS